MFIIRAVFWLTVVLLLIPGSGSKDETSFTSGAADALLAARGVVADLSGICQRQPDVCVHGGAALQSLGARAWQNAAMIAGRFGGHSAGANAYQDAEPVAAVPATGTLRAEDIAPRVLPAAHPDGKA